MKQNEPETPEQVNERCSGVKRRSAEETRKFLNGMKVDLRDWTVWLPRPDPLREKVLMLIAWRLPRSLVYWCALRLLAHATQGKYGNQVVPELLAIDALKRWEE
jgi:hypothetical protein